jgi:hypothetical protein
MSVGQRIILKKKLFQCACCPYSVMIPKKTNHSHAKQQEKTRVIEKQGPHKEEQVKSEIIPYLSMQRRRQSLGRSGQQQ